jgi:prevent-host-death family protein
MSRKTIASARFKADCLKVIDELSRDPRPVTITRHGRPVAVISPAPAQRPTLIGALKGSVLRFDDPTAPAADPADWSAGH